MSEKNKNTKKLVLVQQMNLVNFLGPIVPLDLVVLILVLECGQNRIINAHRVKVAFVRVPHARTWNESLKCAFSPPLVLHFED